MSKHDVDVPTRDRWAPPPDYVALTTEEYLVQQRYIRDRANEELTARLEAGTLKGTASLQRMAIDAATEVLRVEAELLVAGQASGGSRVVFSVIPTDVEYEQAPSKDEVN